MARPLTILISSLVAERFAAAVGEVLHGAPYRLLTPDQADASALDVEIDIAFISRDVTGPSTKTDLSPGLLDYYRHLRGATRLRWVHAHSAGADRPIYPELLARGVRVTTSSGANAAVVAQSALAGLLALARRFPALLEAQRQHAWRPLLGPASPPPLAGQTALVVGFGPIGQQLSHWLDALGLQVSVMRRSPGPDPASPLAAPLTPTVSDDPTPRSASQHIGERPTWPRTIGFAQLDYALPRTDWLILACPLTPTTRQLIDARRLALMPTGAHLINVARGEVVVEADVIDALERKALAGAYLDVFESEPLAAGSPLWGLPNVIVSPHSAGHSTGHFDSVARIWLDNLLSWRDGAALLNEVQP